MKKRLRHNEYYNMQQIFDNLYSYGKNNNNFYNLMEIIKLDDNIKLAFRNIKKIKAHRQQEQMVKPLKI